MKRISKMGLGGMKQMLSGLMSGGAPGGRPGGGFGGPRR